MRLFVIGNGFDLNLGLNTEYRDFYHYLKNNYPDFLLEMGEILWAENETDNLWCNFEKELAQVNFIPFTSLSLSHQKKDINLTFPLPNSII